MSVPSTREPQKIPVSQVTRGLDAVRFSCQRNGITVPSRIWKRRIRIFKESEHK
jgi:hypothetical protein